MQVIIARYQEDITWSNNIHNRIIYNKGKTIESKANVINIPNVGREGHTFAYHIVANYDNLADYTCFLQGNPFDHCANVLDLLALPPTSSFTFLACQLQCNLNRCKYHSGIPLSDCYLKLFNSDRTTDFTFGSGAQMIVSRDAILRHPKEFYQKIVDMLSYSVHPIEGFVIERFWGIIFNEN